MGHFNLAATGLPDTEGERFTQPKLDGGQAGDGEANRAEADFDDATCGRACFHSSSLVLLTSRALIENPSSGIEDINGHGCLR